MLKNPSGTVRMGADRPIGMWKRALGFASVLMLVAAGPALAEDSPAAGQTSAEAAQSVECPFLTQVRYPFIRCQKDALGNVVFDSAPQIIEGLRIPAMDSFIEGPGYWGS